MNLKILKHMKQPTIEGVFLNAVKASKHNYILPDLVRRKVMFYLYPNCKNNTHLSFIIDWKCF